MDLFNPQINVDSGAIFFWVTLIIGLILWFLIIGFFGWFSYKWFRFRVPVEIYEKRGTSIVKTGVTKAREIIKRGITRYEIRTLLGLFMGSRREFYYHPSSEYTISTTKGKGVEFKLLKLGFNAYNPISMNVYSNTFEKTEEQLKEKAEKTEKEIEGLMKNPKENKTKLKEMFKNYYTYVPIQMNPSPVADFEVIPQNLLPNLAREIVETNQTYGEKRWWEPYVFPFSIMLFLLVQFLLVSWLIDKTAGAGATCVAAERGIKETLIQKIT